MTRVISPGVSSSRALTLALALSSPVHAGSAMAQTAAVQPAESASAQAAAGDEAAASDIIVTANRREQNLQSVSASLSVLGSEALANQGIDNTLDLARAVPNLTVEPVVGIAAPRIFVRGVGTIDFNANATNPVTTNVDEVYIGFLNAIAVQIFDVERIEVLRGPQGTLYGRNTTAGALNYISRGPSEEYGGQARLLYGRFDARQVEAAVTGPIAGDTLTARLAVNYDARDGLGTNQVTGRRDLGRRESWAVRGLLRLRPTETTDLLLNVHGGRAEADQVPWTVRGTLDPTTGAPCSPGDVEALRCVNALGYRRQGLGRYDAEYDYTGLRQQGLGETLRNFGASLRAEQDVGFATLTSISAYERNRYRRVEDTDGTPLAILGNDNYDRFAQYSQELRLASPGSKRFNWIVGAYYYRDRLRHTNDTDILRELRPLLGFSPADFVFTSQQNYLQKTRAWAVFGRADYEILPDLRLAGGVRYTNEKRSFDITTDLVEPTFRVNVVDAQRRISNDNVSGEVKLEYAPSRDLLIYASISRGFKSGGFNGGLAFDNAAVTSFAPETLTSYEAGLKSQWWDRRVTLNASAFYYDYKDLQLFTFVNSSGLPISVQDNAGTARVYGLEAELLVSPLRVLDLSASLGLLSTRLTSYQTSFGENYTGNRLPGAPRATLQLAADWHFPVRDFDVRARFDAAYRSRSFYTTANSPFLRRPPFWVAGARVAITPPGTPVTLALVGQNIFNKRYDNAVQDLTSFGEYFSVPADPATWSFELSARF